MIKEINTLQNVCNSRIDVLEIQGKLLEKIEELTLHLISQEERIKQLESKLSARRKQ